MKNRIIELIDFEKVNILLEGFNKSTGFVTAILDLKGNVLSKSGWRQICTEFHRINPDTSKRCTISDTVLAVKLADGEKYHFYKCLNGLVDVAVPIVIKGEHIANLFSGQFFFERPDILFFKKQAKKYGFEEELYLNALSNVPVISEEKVKVAMDFLLNMTELIVEMAVQRVEQTELNNALSESEKRFSELLENVRLLAVLLDLNGKVTYCNSFLLSLTGYEKEELLGSDWFEKMVPDSSPETKKVFLKGLESGEIVEHFENPILTKNGELRNIFWNNTILKNSAGNIIGTASIGEDITKSKQAEENLKIYQSRLVKAQEIGRLGYWQQDIGSDMIWASEEAKKIYGFPAISGELHMTKIGACIGDIELVRQAAIDLIEKNKKYDIEFPINPADRSPKKIISAKAELEKDKQGKPMRIMGVLQDITQQKQAEEAIHQFGTKYRSLFDSIRDAIIVADTNRNIIDCNLAFTSTFGYNLDEIIGKQTVYVYEKEEEFNELGKALKEHYGNSPFLKTVNYKKKSGEVFPGETGIYYLKDADGLVTGFIGLIRDITERLKAEINLRASEERFRAYINQAADALFVHDFSGQFIDVNPQACKNLGYSREELLNMSVFDLELDFDLPRAQDAWSKIQPNQQFILLGHQRRKDGSIFPVEVQFGCFDLVGKRHYMGLARDITERKEAEEDLKNRMDELDKFNKLMVGRENKMVDLKEEINILLEQLAKPPKYKT